MTLGSEFRREVRVAFSADGRSLACEAAGAAAIVDTAGGATSMVALPGRLTGIAFLERSGGRSGAWLLAARDGAGAEIAAVRPPGAVLARVPLGRRAAEAAAQGAWTPDSPSLGVAGDTVLVAFAGSLVGLGLEAR